MKNQLIASSATKEGITKLITSFYMGSNISLNQSGSIYEVHNGKGKINGVHVIKKGNKFRFESIS